MRSRAGSRGTVGKLAPGRLGNPEEIVTLAAVVASNGAAFVTGANFSVNSGRHRH
ncbi:MAG: hypothetical protein OER43_17470 [Gammaproteobacteria bacterium]|nr:hypothetical protein [Gammaproteobacteria bacterium]